MTAGPSGTSWIDIFAFSKLTVIDGTGNDISETTSATPTSRPTPCTRTRSTAPTTHPGVVTAKVKSGPLTASGKAFEASSTLTDDTGHDHGTPTTNSSATAADGGTIDLEASGTVTLDTAWVNASGDFFGGAPCPSGSGACGVGGHIIVSSWGSDLIWRTGSGDVRPNASGDHRPQRLRLDRTTGTDFHGEVPTLTHICDATKPDIPVITSSMADSSSTRTVWALCGGSSVSGIKFNDLNGNGVQDAGEPRSRAGRSRSGTRPRPCSWPQPTTAADGSYTFTVPAGAATWSARRFRPDGPRPPRSPGRRRAPTPAPLPGLQHRLPGHLRSAPETRSPAKTSATSSSPPRAATSSTTSTATTCRQPERRRRRAGPQRLDDHDLRCHSGHPGPDHRHRQRRWRQPRLLLVPQPGTRRLHGLRSGPGHLDPDLPPRPDPASRSASNEGTIGWAITLVGGQNDTDNNFGNWQPFASKSGMKFNDLNGNHIHDGRRRARALTAGRSTSGTRPRPSSWPQPRLAASGTYQLPESRARQLRGLRDPPGSAGPRPSHTLAPAPWPAPTGRSATRLRSLPGQNETGNDFGNWKPRLTAPRIRVGPRRSRGPSTCRCPT